MTIYAANASKRLGRDYWMVVNSFSFYIGKKEDNVTITVPAGYLTDGGTIPRLFWVAIPPWGDHGQAAILHDHLCEYLVVSNNGTSQAITRKQADEILLTAMEVTGVPKLKRNIIYYAVSLFRVVTNRKKASFNHKKFMIEEELRKELSGGQYEAFGTT